MAGPPPPPPPRDNDWPDPTREQQIRETRIAVMESASAALRSCAVVLTKAAEALAEEEA